MKTRSILLSLLFLLGTANLFAQSTTKKFSVKGGCEQCENNIETAAQSVAGVTMANWDAETQIMEVTFDADKTTEDAVQAAIATAGHDTPMHKATAEAYKKSSECCHFEREGNLDKKEVQPDKGMYPDPK